MPNIVIYSTTVCPYCVRAKMLLDRKKVPYQEIIISHNDKLRDEMIEKSGRQSVPQIFINDEHIGGCDDLYALDKAGLLDSKLGL